MSLFERTTNEDEFVDAVVAALRAYRIQALASALSQTADPSARGKIHQELIEALTKKE